MPDHSRLGRSGRYAAGTATAESSSGGWEVSLFRETKAAFQGSWPTIGSSSSSFEGGGERTPHSSNIRRHGRILPATATAQAQPLGAAVGWACEWL
jgi:hypothetical protein